MSKALVCSCEDVTTADVEHAIARGFTDIESVKRYTGFGTGFCQGKSCVAQAGAMLARAGHAATVTPFTPRPPTTPTPLAVWASAPVGLEERPVGGTPPLEGRPPPPASSREPLPGKAEVVI